MWEINSVRLLYTVGPNVVRLASNLGSRETRGLSQSALSCSCETASVTVQVLSQFRVGQDIYDATAADKDDFRYRSA